MVTASNSGQTEAVLGHHLQAFGSQDIDEILKDFTDDSVLFTPDGPVRGLTQLRGFFEQLLQSVPQSSFEAFQMLQQQIEGDVAYIAWSMGDFAPIGTDTFVVRNGKIAVQTFAAYIPSLQQS